MLPWINFRHAIWQQEKIEMYFHGWHVDILGENLAELWKELQWQNVLTIQKSIDTQIAECIVRSIKVTATKENEKEPDAPQLEPFQA